jgi:hypothetical protein
MTTTHFSTASEFILTRTTEIRRYRQLKSQVVKGSAEYRYYGQRIKRLTQELNYMKAEARRLDPLKRIRLA